MKRSKGHILKFCFVGSALLLLASCASQQPPQNMDDACSIFEQYPDWYWSAREGQRNWGVPVKKKLAIMYQESRFDPTIRPPRTHLFGVIPWFRPTTAFGYTQSLDETWRRYQYATHSYAANRDDFDDATDFIGWYGYTIRVRLGTPFISAEDLYLAYHEVENGYLHKSYMSKPWLIQVAQKVQRRANMYQAQLEL